MPSHDLLLHFQRDLSVEKTWRLNGKHYAKTSRHWLNLMDENREPILASFADPKAYGDQAYTW